MFHLLLHFIVPMLVAAALYRPAWRSAFLVMVATMVVDADHLLATPIYDPDRCSIGFHPLHGTPAIAAYAALFLLPLLFGRSEGRLAPVARNLHLVGLGLLIHMALDGIDCLV
jgi:hypothetical protein